MQISNREGKVIIIDNRNSTLAMVLGMAIVGGLFYLAWSKKYRSKIKKGQTIE